MNSKPLFISLEGGDGTGKTTQLKLLSSYIQILGHKTLLTREPGGCDTANQLRSMLLEGDGAKWDGISEALLFSAARNEHLRQVVRPALSEGSWVITDRFADSTTVFQGDGRGMPREQLLQLHNWVVKDTWPDLTLILDLPYEAGLARKEQQAAEGLKETRMESLGAEFHEKVRQGFLQIAEENPQRCKVIDASGTVEEIHTRIIDCLNTFLGK